MPRVLALALLLASCGRVGFENVPEDPDASLLDGSPPRDAATLEGGAADVGPRADGPSPADLGAPEDLGPLPCTDWSFAPSQVDPCGAPVQSGPLVLSEPGRWLLETTSGTLSSPSGSESTVGAVHASGAWLVSVPSLWVQAGVSLRPYGDRPLMVVAADGIRIDGTIDVSTHEPSSGIRPEDKGPGADPPECAAGGTGEDGVFTGGGGGGFGSRGGDGGDPADGRSRGGSALTAPPATLRGGCSGGIDSWVAVAGGGALALVAARRIEIRGALDAGGSGGFAALAGSGGGGAGSGGLLHLESPQVVVSGELAANGGGGGGEDTDGVPGGLGRIPAPGGPGGGAGAAGTQEAQAGTMVEAEFRTIGGGGGGGVGWIVVRGSLESSGARSISPPPTVLPL